MYVFNIIVFLHIKNTNDLDQENTSILQELSKHLSFFSPSEGEASQVLALTGISSLD